MTLELGVDIGDVDLVALVGPPTSVASFLQRLGRGSRRSDRCRVLACARDRGEQVRFAHLAHLARSGDLCPEPYRFRPSVLVQQAGSMLLQSPERLLSVSDLGLQLPPALAGELGPQRIAKLLAEQARHGWLVPARLGRYAAGPRLLEAFDRPACTTT